MARIELKNVRKSWVGATAVERIDLTIDDGAFVAVLGPVGLRQDDDAADARRHLQPDRGRDRVRRRAGERRRSARPQRRHRVPVLRALSEHERAREHHVPAAVQEGRTRGGGDARPRDRRAGAHRRSSSTGGRRSSPAASSSAWRSPARSSSGRTSCCSTSRCRISTRRCACRCAPRSGAFSASSA